MELGFTRRIESELDHIEESHRDWVQVVRDFYDPLARDLATAEDRMTHARAEATPSSHKCPKCGAMMAYRLSKRGAATGGPLGIFGQGQSKAQLFDSTNPTTTFAELALLRGAVFCEAVWRIGHNGVDGVPRPRREPIHAVGVKESRFLNRECPLEQGTVVWRG